MCLLCQPAAHIFVLIVAVFSKMIQPRALIAGDIAIAIDGWVWILFDFNWLNDCGHWFIGLLSIMIARGLVNNWLSIMSSG